MGFRQPFVKMGTVKPLINFLNDDPDLIILVLGVSTLGKIHHF